MDGGRVIWMDRGVVVVAVAVADVIKSLLLILLALVRGVVGGTMQSRRNESVRRSDGKLSAQRPSESGTRLQTFPRSQCIVRDRLCYRNNDFFICRK